VSVAQAVKAPALYVGLVVTATLVAFVLRVFRLSDAGLWLDELLTLYGVTLPWSQLPVLVTGDNQAPLYFVMLKAWIMLDGTSPVALRMPGVILSTAATPLVAVSAARLIGRPAALWAAWLVALSPFLIHDAQEARPYPQLFFLAAVHVYLISGYLSGARISLGWLFALVSLALLLTHYAGAFLIVGEILALLLLRPRPYRAWAPSAAVTCAVTALVLCLYAWLSARLAGAAYHVGFSAFPGAIWSLLGGYSLVPTSYDVHYQGLKAALPYLPFAVVGGSALALLALIGTRCLNRTAAVLLWAVLPTSVLGPLIASPFVHILAKPRYLAASIPALFLIIAAGAPAALRDRWISWVATGLVVATMVVGTTLHLSQPGHDREDVLAAGRWLDANLAADEEIVLTSSEMDLIDTYHWHHRRYRLYPETETGAPIPNAPELAESFPFPQPGHRAFYVIGRGWLSDPDGALQTELARRYRTCPGTEVRGIRIICLLPDGA
jgi:4-amino-4-deoxy-L-arabinose transferase-like glycosyltransferase